MYSLALPHPELTHPDLQHPIGVKRASSRNSAPPSVAISARGGWPSVRWRATRRAAMSTARIGVAEQQRIANALDRLQWERGKATATRRPWQRKQ
jgi:hypothetical protein